MTRPPHDRDHRHNFSPSAAPERVGASAHALTAFTKNPPAVHRLRRLAARALLPGQVMGHPLPGRRSARRSQTARGLRSERTGLG